MNKTVKILLMVIVVVVIAAIVFYNRKKIAAATMTVTQKRDKILQWEIMHDNDDVFVQKLFSMNDSEVSAMYKFLFDYYEQNKTVPEGSSLYLQINAMSQKYTLFN